MKDLIMKLWDLKAEAKNINKEIKEELMKDSQYAEFLEDKKASGEVLRSHASRLIADSVSLSALRKKITDKGNEIKIVKQAIKDGVMVVSKESGEQLSMDFNI